MISNRVVMFCVAAGTVPFEQHPSRRLVGLTGRSARRGHLTQSRVTSAAGYYSEIEMRGFKDIHR